MLARDPAARLGKDGANGLEELQKLEFFKGFNWDTLLQRKHQPPFVPVPPSAAPIDVSCFPQKYTQQRGSSACEPATPPVGSSEDAWVGFSYTDLSIFDSMAKCQVESESRLREADGLERVSDRSERREKARSWRGKSEQADLRPDDPRRLSAQRRRSLSRRDSASSKFDHDDELGV